MTASFAIAGWIAAAVLALRARALAGRLRAVGDAEHELRGPLAAVVLAVESARRRPALRGLADSLESELVRARAGLADLTAARSGRPGSTTAARPELEPAGFEHLVRSTAQAWGRTRRVSVDWRAGSVPLRRDAGALAKALGNVLSNAAEHGAGPIELRASRRSGDVLIEVTNPVSPAARKSVRGLGRERGRGLGIARRSAAALGGELEFEAERARVRTALVVPVDG